MFSFTFSNVQKILENEEMGDRTPSEFLKHLRNQLKTFVPDDILKQIWMKKLPSRLQRNFVRVERDFIRLNKKVNNNLSLDEISHIMDKLSTITRNL